MPEDFRNEFYKDYIDFKQWNQASDINPAEMFEIEFQRLGHQTPLKVFEIGFGKGELLDWAREKGHDVSGIEIIPELVRQAQARGHRVHQMSVQELKSSSIPQGEFDLVVIFDVLEHLYVHEIIELLKNCHRLLKPNGQLMVRFPNGLSPIGLVQHMKDITHITILSPDRMEQLGRITGFHVVFSGNTARSLSQGKNPRWMRVILYRLRNFLETIIGLLYYGGRAPLDPNMTVILKKSQ